ncbi:hypothetical protein [Marinobacter sp.]|uniref:hypothetical protein n=1 Tax=Marinobacter sp. TaxID=50741 RepID=UPI003BAD30F7
MNIRAKNSPFAFALLVLAVSPVAVEARAIGGVSCNGGFFVNAPDKRIFWIQDSKGKKTEVHDGSEKMVVVAECGDGVVSVFADDSGRSRAFYSPDCNNISKPEGVTQQIYEGDDAVTGLDINNEGLKLELDSGEEIESQVCSRR